jgi:hypothetical protein
VSRVIRAIPPEHVCQPSQHPSTVAECGWEREVDSHQRIAERIGGILTALGEPFDPPGVEPRSGIKQRRVRIIYIGSHVCPIRTAPARR